MSASRRIATLSILASAVLAIAKIATCIAGHSVAVVSDGIESCGDVLTSSLVLVAVRLAAKPADADHPYGHGRVDILAGLAVGVALLLAALGIFWRTSTAAETPPELFAM